MKAKKCYSDGGKVTGAKTRRDDSLARKTNVKSVVSASKRMARESGADVSSYSSGRSSRSARGKSYSAPAAMARNVVTGLTYTTPNKNLKR